MDQLSTLPAYCLSLGSSSCTKLFTCVAAMFSIFMLKGHTLDIVPHSEETSLQKHSGMAHVIEGYYSFTCTPTRLSTNKMNHTCFCFPSRSWSSFTDPRGMEGWVGLSTMTASKQSAQDRYVTAVTVISCSSRRASLGNWSTGEPSIELTTSRATSRDANHWAIESPMLSFNFSESIKQVF